jgi:hypothetical protein
MSLPLLPKNVVRARIKQDVLKVFDSMEKFLKAGGILVEGLGKNYGRRYENVTIRQPRGWYI